MKKEEALGLAAACISGLKFAFFLKKDSKGSVLTYSWMHFSCFIIHIHPDGLFQRRLGLLLLTSFFKKKSHLKLNPYPPLQGVVQGSGKDLRRTEHGYGAREPSSPSRAAQGGSRSLPLRPRRHFVRPPPARALYLAFKSAARAAPSSTSYQQGARSGTAAWPAAPRAGRPAGSKAVRRKERTRTRTRRTRWRSTRSFIHPAAPRSFIRPVAARPLQKDTERRAEVRETACGSRPAGCATARALSCGFTSRLSAV